MVKVEKDDFFEKLEEKYHFLNNFQLGKLYSSFILKDNAEESIKDLCGALSKKDSKPNCDLSSICSTVATLLAQLKTEFNEKARRSFSQECKYLNYWIYYNIKDSLQCNSIGSLYQLLNMVKSPYIPPDHSCDIKYFEITKEIFHTKKELFFHAEILHWIKDEYEFINNSEKDFYNKYLEECFNIYKRIICNNDSQKREDYKVELSNFRENYNGAITSLKQKHISISQEIKQLENESMCQIQSSKHPVGELQATTAQDGVTQDKVSGREGQEPGKNVPKPGTERLGLTKEFQATERVPEPVKLKEHEGQAGLAQAQVPGILDPRGPEDEASRGSMNEENNDDSPIRDMPNKVGTVGATLAGSSLFLLMMYKYTPLGSWISTKILGRNKLMDNLKKNNYELLLNDVGNHEASLNDTMYHVRYNSSTNN
ncbi:Plasmodium vivax Vir protein, putative [Plasmodium vivax]|uniref:Vir protein, putative n=1 Tax=Plasmodium vivax TaxID=5855 RepID=A0A1G4E4C4_PLAVI|nr:Plasmodium vivax Vir protein, putative [Plasmodium vivax]